MTSDNLPPLPEPPVGALTDGEAALLRQWAQTYAARAVAEAIAPLKVRILELEAVHEDASGQILEAVAQERERWQQEAEDDARTREMMRDILTRVAVAVRGEPPPLTSWGWHDLPDRVAAVVHLAAALASAKEPTR